MKKPVASTLKHEGPGEHLKGSPRSETSWIFSDSIASSLSPLPPASSRKHDSGRFLRWQKRKQIHEESRLPGLMRLYLHTPETSRSAPPVPTLLKRQKKAFTPAPRRAGRCRACPAQLRRMGTARGGVGARSVGGLLKSEQGQQGIHISSSNPTSSTSWNPTQSKTGTMLNMRNEESFDTSSFGGDERCLSGVQS